MVARNIRRVVLAGELTINLNVTSSGSTGDDAKLNQILALLGQSAVRETQMALDTTALAAEVTGMADTIEAGLLVLDSIADALEEANVDHQPAIDALTADLRAARETLAEGIASPGTEEPPA